MRTKTSSKLTEKERKDLMSGLCGCLLGFKDPVEVAEALTDLLYPKEIESIAKRLKIAELLVEGWDYAQIKERLKVGNSTVARVNTWLNLSGKGFAHLLKRKPKDKTPRSEEEIYDPWSWGNFKRRYSMYFWPQLLLEELVKQSDKKEREKIAAIFDQLKIKASTFTSKSNKELFQSFSKSVN